MKPHCIILLIILMNGSVISKSQNSTIPTEKKSAITQNEKAKEGFYIKWNIDVTHKRVKPSIPITEEEAKTINCYYVKFDKKDRLTSVQYFLSGQPSNKGNYGAFELRRTYNKKGMKDMFYDTNGKSVLNSSGAGMNKYSFDKNGFWIKKEAFDLNNKPVEVDGVAITELTRNENNEIKTWIRYDIDLDTVPFYNKLKKTHILFDEKGQLAYMQNHGETGNLKNGEMGVAEVSYKYDDNGILLSKEFRDENKKPIMHPTLKFSRIEYREFNKYGFPKRFYCIDEKGYPMETGIIEYNENMTRKKKTYFNRYGEIIECAFGFAYAIYHYNEKGEFIKESRFNLAGEEL